MQNYFTRNVIAKSCRRACWPSARIWRVLRFLWVVEHMEPCKIKNTILLSDQRKESMLYRRFKTLVAQCRATQTLGVVMFLAKRLWNTVPNLVPARIQGRDITNVFITIVINEEQILIRNGVGRPNSMQELKTYPLSDSTKCWDEQWIFTRRSQKELLPPR